MTTNALNVDDCTYNLKRNEILTDYVLGNRTCFDACKIHFNITPDRRSVK